MAVTSVNDQQSQNRSPKAYSSSQEQSEGQLDFFERTVSDPVSLFTFFLVVVAAGQLRLFWWQLDLIRDSVKDTNIAAIAAQSSANIAERALTTLERPFVYCSVSKPGIKTGKLVFPNGASKIGTQFSTLELSVYNFGRTPARLTRFFWQAILHGEVGICPPVDPSIEGGRELPIGTMCAKDDPFIESEHLRTRFSSDDEAIASNRKVVWVVGFIRYDDIFGAHHINGFALKFDTERQRFVRSGGAAYNYERKEKDGDIPFFPTSVE